ncbi:hypothetical protein CALCODRAFT_498379 [Calocera cornea HHB12733]|uniref:Uncharacterized protein n=1 Tax=Calocera cornea HHB12733 TaxID=1353952 RepID=A0A165EVY4_9BASI|nr:hypothetical protein CALCODRAFT_498379 [Calocera cornea HHB12733]
MRTVLLCGLSLLSISTTLLYLQRAPFPTSFHPALSEHLSHHWQTLTQPIQFSWPLYSSSSAYPGATECPWDPFSAPGMIHWGSAPNDTRWVPFPQDLEAYKPDPRLARLDKLDSEWKGLTEREMEALGAGERLMLDMGTGGAEWATGRNVLLLGDSHDRNNVFNFCKEMKGKHTSWGGHTGGWCRVERLNFTIAYWFLYGITDSDYAWFADREKPPKTPESRFSEVFLPRMVADGMADWQPDMIMANSLFWDTDHLFDQYFAEFGIKRRSQEGLSFQEVRYHQQRVVALLRLLRAQFGPLVPMMYRSRHLRSSNDRGLMLRIAQLDQGWRAVGEAMGVRVFDWGSRLEGFTDFYDGKQHFPPGPVTWLFGDMLLHYLREAMDPERWWACL